MHFVYFLRIFFWKNWLKLSSRKLLKEANVQLLFWNFEILAEMLTKKNSDKTNWRAFFILKNTNKIVFQIFFKNFTKIDKKFVHKIMETMNKKKGVHSTFLKSLNLDNSL